MYEVSYNYIYLVLNIYIYIYIYIYCNVVAQTLYSFCVFAVWITFRRKDYDCVKKEIGRYRN